MPMMLTAHQLTVGQISAQNNLSDGCHPKIFSCPLSNIVLCSVPSSGVSSACCCCCGAHANVTGILNFVLDQHILWEFWQRFVSATLIDHKFMLLPYFTWLYARIDIRHTHTRTHTWQKNKLVGALECRIAVDTYHITLCLWTIERYTCVQHISAMAYACLSVQLSCLFLWRDVPI